MIEGVLDGGDFLSGRRVEWVASIDEGADVYWYLVTTAFKASSRIGSFVRGDGRSEISLALSIHSVGLLIQSK